MTVTLADFFADGLPEQEKDPLRAELIAMVKQRHENTPRHQQVELGPSEVGHPCMRKMAYGMTGAPECNPDYDPLPSIIGTATHTWMESAARLDNERLGRTRWVMERRVEVTGGLSGSCDLFDLDTNTVIDYKFPGYTSFTKYLKDPGLTYRNQVHLYGKGFENAGHIVNTVAIAFFPRAGTLSKLHLWKEPYDPQRVAAVLKRREQVIGLCDDLRVEVDPQRYQWIPATPDSCVWCSWWSLNPTSGFQCEGKK